RQHFKSDWHNFNLRRKVRQLPLVTEPEFEKLIETLDESISGSEPSGDEEDISTDDDQDRSSENKDEDNMAKLDRLLINTSLNRSSLADFDDKDQNQIIPVKSPFIYVRPRDMPTEKCLAFYKEMIDMSQIDFTSSVSLVRELQLQKALASHFNFKTISPNDKTSIVIMIGGGHFSAAIFSHKLDKSHSMTSPIPVLSKSFHRYTTRRKQGGSQAAFDSSKGKANSAGSTLRRAMEKMLTEEIRQLFQSWNKLGYIKNCWRIWIRASGKNSRNVILGAGEITGLTASDKRIHGIPFTTRRATATEVKRVWFELTSLKVVDTPQVVAAKAVNAVKSSASLTLPSSKVKKPASLSLAEKHTAALLPLVKQARIPRILSYIRLHKLNVDTFQLVSPSINTTVTPILMHYAASIHAHKVVQSLLMSLKANPTITNELGRTPWQVIGNSEEGKRVKDIFRLARYELGEACWDWSAAGVDKPLTRDDLERQDQKAKIIQEEERIEAEKSMLEREKLENERRGERFVDRIIKKSGTGKKLGVQTGVQGIGIGGLSEEARVKLERERRAKAAEERFKKI
ncbi:hypothetical protein NADFUDRAFT_12406, partial [Nadsonia fulvescens var. elongata DSM 6958]